MITPVTLFCRAKACVLPHGPQPAAIHLRMNAAGKGELARKRIGRAAFISRRLVHEREILRARRKEDTPKQIMMIAKIEVMTSFSTLDPSPSNLCAVRKAESTAGTARQIKRNPMISFHSTRMGRITPGRTKCNSLEAFCESLEALENMETT